DISDDDAIGGFDAVTGSTLRLAQRRPGRLGSVRPARAHTRGILGRQRIRRPAGLLVRNAPRVVHVPRCRASCAPATLHEIGTAGAWLLGTGTWRRVPGAGARQRFSRGPPHL